MHSELSGTRRDQNSKYTSIQSMEIPPRQLPLEQQ